MPLSVNLPSPSGPGQTEAGRYPGFLLAEPWTLFHRRFPLSLPLSSALLSHPETDHLRQWDESRRGSETKRQLLDNRGPASALVSLMGVGEVRSLIGCLRCRFSSWNVTFMSYSNTRRLQLRFKEITSGCSHPLRRPCFLIIGFFVLNALTRMIIAVVS